MVLPSRCVAAMPVDAVIAGSKSCSRSQATYWLSTCVLPEPASPVRYTECPIFKISSACCCVISSLYQRGNNNDKLAFDGGVLELCEDFCGSAAVYGFKFFGELPSHHDTIIFSGR